MRDFLSRLKEEKTELLDKVTKLSAFLSGAGNSDRLTEANELLLKHQLNIMNEYLNVLIIRIELLEK